MSWGSNESGWWTIVVVRGDKANVGWWRKRQRMGGKGQYLWGRWSAPFGANTEFIRAAHPHPNPIHARSTNLALQEGSIWKPRAAKHTRQPSPSWWRGMGNPHWIEDGQLLAVAAGKSPASLPSGYGLGWDHGSSWLVATHTLIHAHATATWNSGEGWHLISLVLSCHVLSCRLQVGRQIGSAARLVEYLGKMQKRLTFLLWDYSELDLDLAAWYYHHPTAIF